MDMEKLVKLFFFLIIFSVAIFILYLVIKQAVKDGLLEANEEKRAMRIMKKQESVPMTTCPDCWKSHESAFPRCPFCGYVYTQQQKQEIE